jgi:hypothetical protein
MKKWVLSLVICVLSIFLPRQPNLLILGAAQTLPVKVDKEEMSISDISTLSYQYPLKINTNKRYLVDQNNQPFFMSGDAAWSLIAQLNKADVDLYLNNRQQKGFNSILVSLIEHQFATKAPANIYGDYPFSGKTFTTPNETYFSHADYVINEASKRGIIVMLAPLYLGYDCGSEGWCNEVKAATNSDMQTWGTYVGNRYKNNDNIIWVIGGDTNPVTHNVQGKVTSFVNALLLADNRHLVTAHNAPEEMAVTPWSGSSWLSINNVYTYNLTYTIAKTAYNYSPVLPFFQLEGKYENERNATQQELRSQAYWAVLSGGLGYIFGNGPLWCYSASTCPFGSGTWKTELDKQGSTSMSHAKNLFSSLPWYSFVPDWSHSVLTAGYGTWGQADYVLAAVSSNVSTLVAYVPSSRQVTLNMAKFSMNMTAKWYDPTNGAYTPISPSTIPNSGTMKFTPPSSNAAGDKDWVLVLQPSTINFNYFNRLPFVTKY